MIAARASGGAVAVTAQSIVVTARLVEREGEDPPNFAGRIGRTGRPLRHRHEVPTDNHDNDREDQQPELAHYGIP
jgi:hypothetical protein